MEWRLVDTQARFPQCTPKLTAAVCLARVEKKGIKNGGWPGVVVLRVAKLGVGRFRCKVMSFHGDNDRVVNREVIRP